MPMPWTRFLINHSFMDLASITYQGAGYFIAAHDRKRQSGQADMSERFATQTRELAVMAHPFHPEANAV